MSTIEDWGDGTFYQRPKEHEEPPRIDRSGGTWWPAGGSAVPNDRLRQLLALSARWHARTAIASYIKDDDLDDLLQAAVSVGSAVELMAKAYCASISPALLADKGDRDSILILDGQSAFAKCEPTQIKTISAYAALQTLAALHSRLPTGIPTAPALRVRNAATHLALVDVDELRDGIIHMCRLVEGVLVRTL